ncbi:MAG: FkbM family methyltransferase [Bacteroidia bacterium]
MSKLNTKLLYKFSGLFHKVHRFFYNSARAAERSTLPVSEINKEKWYADNCEKKLRYDYELNENSIVIDVGGYEGDFASEIYSRYRCKIFVFEPVKKYVDILNKRFKQNPSIVIVSKGLGAKNEQLTIHVMDEASSYNRSASIHKQGAPEKISIIDVKLFFEENTIKHVDLIKINIEGAEYDLLDRMIECGYIFLCTNLQIQFHDFYPDYASRYQKIKSELEKTHKLTYCYPFVWENWQLK